MFKHQNFFGHFGALPGISGLTLKAAGATKTFLINPLLYCKTLRNFAFHRNYSSVRQNLIVTEEQKCKIQELKTKGVGP